MKAQLWVHQPQLISSAQLSKRTVENPCRLFLVKTDGVDQNRPLTTVQILTVGPNPNRW